MIITEIYVPAFDTSYDFKLDENVLAGVAAEEIASVICRCEQCRAEGDRAKFLLFKAGSGQPLSVNLTLYENGVQTGDSLIFT